MCLRLVRRQPGIEVKPAAAIAGLKSAGIRMVDPEPRKGAGGRMVAFVHPSAPGGVLLELSQSMSTSE